eukprot:EG_transcript_15127
MTYFQWAVRRRPFSLGTVLSAHEGDRVTVELKDGTKVTGEIEEVHLRQSLTLENATLCKPKQPSQSARFQKLFVHHRAISSVALPDGPLGIKLDRFARKLLASKLAETRKNRRPLLQTAEEKEAEARRRLAAFQQLQPQSEAEKRPSLPYPGGRTMPEACATNVLYVGGLGHVPGKLHAEEIRQLVEPFGQVMQVHFVPATGCAFITMDSISSATCARDFYPSGFAELRGKRVPIRFAWPKKPSTADVYEGLTNLELLASECLEVANAGASP